MRNFAQTPKAPKQTASANPAISGRAHLGQSRDVTSILRLQRTIGNQAVQRLLEANPGNVAEDSTTIGLTRFGDDLSPIPVSDNALVQSSEKPTASARRTASVLQGLQAARDAAANPGAGEPLSRSDREAMSERFGYDFGRVRVHTDSEAARAAGARGFASREHVWFRPGRGPADRALLSHELAHVVQQATGEAHSLSDPSKDLVRRDWLERRARTGGVQRPPVIGPLVSPLPASPHPTVIQFDFEEDTLRDLHRLPAVEEEGISKLERRRRVRVLAARRDRLFALFASLSGTKADEIYERLRVRRKGDVLSERFHDMLSTALREDLLASIGLKEFASRQIVPDPADFCRPFSKREIDQFLDLEMANAMDHFVNGDLRDFWGDEAADLYDKYLTSTEKNVTPKIFDKPRSELVQSFIKHEATDRRQRELAANIEKNLTSNYSYGIEPNIWFNYIHSALIWPREELTAPFSFGGFSTIPAIVAGGVSPSADVPESRTISAKQVLLRRSESGGVTTGAQLRVQFHFVVKDAIDFCPGNMGGFLASYITIPLSRLEASGMAFAVPFEVHYDGPELEIELGPEAVKWSTPRGSK
jgi:Domain of unknown function (DUF4157)